MGGFSKMKPKTGNNDSLKLEEIVEMFKFQDNPDEWIQLRFMDKGSLAVKRHWIKILAGKQKKVVTIPRFCLKFNPEDEDSPHDVDCPYCELSTEGGQDAPMRSEFFYLMNAIIRDIQEEEPARKAKPTKSEAKTGFKDIKSKAWTPVRVVRMTNGMVARAQELGETNIVKKGGKKKSYDISHDKFGCDVNIKYKPKASGSDKYTMDKVEGRTPLTDEEKEYLVWDLTPSILEQAGLMTEAQAIEDFKRMDVIDAEAIDDDSDDDDDDDDDAIDMSSSRKSKSKSKKGKKAKKASTFDDDEDEDEDDEDEAPRKKKKSSTKKKSSVKSKKAKKKKPAFDDDDDDDDDEDEAPRKKKKSSSKKKASTSTKKKSSKTKKAKKKKPAFDEDDEDDWDDE